MSAVFETLRALLGRSEPLLLFLVACLGYLAGQVRLGSFKLGVAGVLFFGLLIGTWQVEGQPKLALGHQLLQVGLILFVYTIGLSSGPGFFAAMRTRGLRFNLAVGGSLLVGALVTLLVGRALGLSPGHVAGIYCGGLTNTPALAAVGQLMQNLGLPDPQAPAVAYSLTYPFGVAGGLLSFQVFLRLYRAPAERERAADQAQALERASLSSACFRVTNPAIVGKAIGELRVQEVVGVILSRHRQGEQVHIPTKYSVLREGDVVKAVGLARDLERAQAWFGEPCAENLEQPGSAISMRRILVSKKALAGQRLGELHLDRRFGAQVTRLRRGDLDMIATPDTVLELGDRVRVVMPADRGKELASFFGDSEREFAELDYTAFTLGIALGVLLGMIPFPLPGGSSLSLGFAGGPLIAGLVLGWVGRTGPLVWTLPHEANQALRHVGLLFFLAVVGLGAGGSFLSELSRSGWQLFVGGVLTTSLTTALTLLALRHWGGASVVEALGATSGMQTQPATLAQAHELTRSEGIFVAYATTYPVAMVLKIVLAQLLLLAAHALGGGVAGPG